MDRRNSSLKKMDALLSGEDAEGVGAKLKVRQKSLKKMSTTGLNIAHDTIATSTKSNTEQQQINRRSSKGIGINDKSPSYGGDESDDMIYSTPKLGRDGTRKNKSSYHGTAWTLPSNNSTSNNTAPSSSSAVVVPTASSGSESPQRFTLSRRQSSRGMIGKLTS